MLPPKIQLRSRVDGMDSRSGSKVLPSDIAVMAENDCDIYRPDGQPLLMLRRGVIPQTISLPIVPVLKRAAVKYATDNRGEYAGINRVAKAGSKNSRTRDANGKVVRVPSIVVGFMDKNGGRQPFCRPTMFTSNETNQWPLCVQLAQFVSSLFEKSLPERYAFQESVVRKTLPEYVIPGSVFTTMTVNLNVAGRIHKDKGDLKSGFGVISCFRGGGYTGGVLVFPEYQVGVDLREGDVVFFNAHDWHGVTDLVGSDDENYRITVVYYYRERIVECKSVEEQVRLLRGKI